MQTIKLSFIGDIMCEKPFLRAAHVKKGVYDFDAAFAGLKTFFEKSDYVIGNLETICAGSDKGYTKELYSFNTPDSFVAALKNCGIDFVSMANNHCLDRGINGLKRTMDILDDYGIGYTGTYRTQDEAELPCVIDIGGLKVGLVAYTYGTNANINGVVLGENERWCVNLLQPQEYHKNTSVAGKVKDLVSIEMKTRIKKICGMPYKNITVDRMPQNLDKTYLEGLANAVAKAKEQADYTICLLHCGGQFNLEPGAYSDYMMSFLEQQGVDSIIGNHPHNIQKSKVLEKGLATYCLGNVSISPSSIYVPMENHPDYSIVVHMYFDVGKAKPCKITASLLKIQEDKHGYLRVQTVNDVYESASAVEKKKIASDSQEVLEVFMGKPIDGFEMQDEWLVAQL